MANVDTKMKIGESGEECCFQLCTKETTCGGYLPYGKFKSRSLSLMCCIFTIMVTSLFIAVIVPLVSFKRFIPLLLSLLFLVFFNLVGLPISGRRY
jgi:hypothetical protein